MQLALWLVIACKYHAIYDLLVVTIILIPKNPELIQFETLYLNVFIHFCREKLPTSTDCLKDNWVGVGRLGILSSSTQMS